MTGYTPGSRASFPRAARLLDRAGYAAVFAKPSKAADRFFTLLGAPSPCGEARLGLAIAKRQVRRAVARNRLKRLAREAFRQRRDRLDATDLVVMARPAAAAASNIELTRSLARLLQRFYRDTARSSTSEQGAGGAPPG